MNRYFRRLHRFGKTFSAVAAPGTPPDVQSARAKSRVKGKVTADKWNQ